MKKIKFLLYSLFVLSLSSACSSGDLTDEIKTRSEITLTFYDLLRIGDGKFYYCSGWFSNMTCLVKKDGDWEETEVDIPEVEYTEEELRDGVMDGNLNRGYGMLFPYGTMMHPNYFWFDRGSVYSDYSEMTTYYTDWQLGDFNYSDIVPFLDYLATETERSDDIFKYQYWLSMLNKLEIEEGNVLKMSFANHPLRINRGADYTYILEEADETNLVIRLEFKERRYGCDAVRITYKSVSQRPAHYQNFNSKEEAKQFIDDILSKLKEE